jgi:Mn-dependent DtxR family transcriptional regulator
MTTRPTVSRTGLDTLTATRRGEVSRESGSRALDFSWRSSPSGPSLTSTVEALERRGLVEEGTPLVVNGEQRTPLVLTDRGRELLEELASREPARKDPDADPS